MYRTRRGLNLLPRGCAWMRVSVSPIGLWIVRIYTDLTPKLLGSTPKTMTNDWFLFIFFNASTDTKFFYLLSGSWCFSNRSPRNVAPLAPKNDNRAHPQKTIPQKTDPPNNYSRPYTSFTHPPWQPWLDVALVARTRRKEEYVCVLLIAASRNFADSISN